MEIVIIIFFILWPRYSSLVFTNFFKNWTKVYPTVCCLFKTIKFNLIFFCLNCCTRLFITILLFFVNNTINIANCIFLINDCLFTISLNIRIVFVLLWKIYKKFFGENILVCFSMIFKVKLKKCVKIMVDF